MTGLTFKGINSSTFNIVMKSDNRQVLPNVTRFIKTLPLYAGSIDFGMDTYQEKTIKVILQYNYKMQPSLLQTTAEQISGWLYNDGNYYDLIFDDMPNRKYKAKVTTAVDLSQVNSLGTFPVEFTCNSPFPYDLSNNPITPADVQARLLWDTALLDSDGITYVQEFTTDGTMQFTNKGTLSVKPVIKIIGYMPNGLTVLSGMHGWQVTKTFLYDCLVFDCNASTITLQSDGSNQYSNVVSINDAFFSIASGQNSISISGVGGAFPNNLAISVTFTPQYS